MRKLETHNQFGVCVMIESAHVNDGISVAELPQSPTSAIVRQSHCADRACESVDIQTFTASETVTTATATLSSTTK